MVWNSKFSFSGFLDKLEEVVTTHKIIFLNQILNGLFLCVVVYIKCDSMNACICCMFVRLLKGPSWHVFQFSQDSIFKSFSEAIKVFQQNKLMQKVTEDKTARTTSFIKRVVIFFINWKKKWKVSRKNHKNISYKTDTIGKILSWYQTNFVQ